MLAVLNRSHDVLELVASSPRTLSVGRLARTIGAPKTSPVRVVGTLVARGHLERSFHDRGYVLGAGLLFVTGKYIDYRSSTFRKHSSVGPPVGSGGSAF